MRYVKTNIGTMPVEDYREIIAMQSGIDDYNDMRKQGYRLGNGYDTEDDAQYEDEAVTEDREGEKR